jgi:hypothetical protein
MQVTGTWEVLSVAGGATLMIVFAVYRGPVLTNLCRLIAPASVPEINTSPLASMLEARPT